MKRMGDVASTLAALIKEADGEAAKYGQDIVLMAAFNNAQKGFDAWIGGSEKKITAGYPSPNNMEEATTMVDDCKVGPRYNRRPELLLPRPGTRPPSRSEPPSRPARCSHWIMFRGQGAWPGI